MDGYLRWSAIATHLPKRTDNEIKNYWNTHLKKRLAKMGIDPITHKPRCDALVSVDGQNKSAANLSHMAQWESARLEAEARLVRESKLRSQAPPPPPFHSQQQQETALPPLLKQTSPPPPPSLDVFKAWQWQFSKAGKVDLQSPTSTLSFSENVVAGFEDNPTTAKIDSSSADEAAAAGGDRRGYENSTRSTSSSLDETAEAAFPSADDDDMVVMFPTTRGPWSPPTTTANAKPPLAPGCFVEGFTDLLLQNSDEDEKTNDNNNNNKSNSEEEEDEDDDQDDEDAKSYWNNILNLVNSSPSSSPLF